MKTTMEFASRAKFLEWARREYRGEFCELLERRLASFDGELGGESLEEFVRSVEAEFADRESGEAVRLSKTIFRSSGKRLLRK